MKRALDYMTMLAGALVAETIPDSIFPYDTCRYRVPYDRLLAPRFPASASTLTFTASTTLVA